MKIVVIGATGNIGRRVVKEALSHGHEVTGVVRDPAATVLDELERPKHIGRRFGVAY